MWMVRFVKFEAVTILAIDKGTKGLRSTNHSTSLQYQIKKKMCGSFYQGCFCLRFLEEKSAFVLIYLGITDIIKAKFAFLSKLRKTIIVSCLKSRHFINKMDSNLLGSVSVFFTILRKNKPRGQKRFWIRTQCKGGLYDRVACPKFRYPTLSSNFYSYTQNT